MFSAWAGRKLFGRNFINFRKVEQSMFLWIDTWKSILMWLCQMEIFSIQLVQSGNEKLIFLQTGKLKVENQQITNYLL